MGNTLWKGRRLRWECRAELARDLKAAIGFLHEAVLGPLGRRLSDELDSRFRNAPLECGCAYRIAA